MAPLGASSAHHRTLAGDGTGDTKAGVPYVDAAKRVKEGLSGPSGWLDGAFCRL